MVVCWCSREIERRLKEAERPAACIDDPRDAASTVHTDADITRFRLLMIAAGYEDGNAALQAAAAATLSANVRPDRYVRHGLARDQMIEPLCRRPDYAEVGL